MAVVLLLDVLEIFLGEERGDCLHVGVLVQQVLAAAQLVAVLPRQAEHIVHGVAAEAVQLAIQGVQHILGIVLELSTRA